MVFRVAAELDHRVAGHYRRLAPEGMESLLALAITPAGNI
jgi:hypothetical protein